MATTVRIVYQFAASLRIALEECRAEIHFPRQFAKGIRCTFKSRARIAPKRIDQSFAGDGYDKLAQAQIERTKIFELFDHRHASSQSAISRLGAWALESKDQSAKRALLTS